MSQSSVATYFGWATADTDNALNMQAKDNSWTKQELYVVGFNPKKIQFFYEQIQLTSFPINIITTSRQCLYKHLLNKFVSLGGEVLFDHEVLNIDLIVFLSNICR